MTNLKQKVAKGAIWTLAEKLSCQAVQFVVAMVLARLLTPTDYGTVTLAGIFFVIAGSIVNCGFGSALIRKKDADELDYNSVFYFQLSMSIFAYIAMFFAAPWIADFYKVQELVPIIRVSACSFIFNAINSVQDAELVKKMLFHLSFRVSLVTTITSAVFGVSLAFMGYRVWALVWASLFSGFAGVIARWFIIAWRPRLMFSVARLRPLFYYGWKMAVSGLLDSFFRQLNGLLIGKFYTRADLAFVDKGRSLPSLAMNEVDATLGRVTFPALVQMQDDKVALREVMRRMMTCSLFLVLPLMVGLAGCSKSLLRLLFGEQWISATPYMMIACFTYALWPFHTINLRGIQAIGRSDVFLVLEIIKKALRVVCILAFFRFGVLVFVAAGAFVFGPLGVVINAWPNRKLLDYTIGTQIRDVLPTICISIVEGVVVFGVDYLFNLTGFGFEKTGSLWSLGSVLFLQFIAGASTFLSLAFAFRLKPMSEYARIASPMLERCLPRVSLLITKRFPR